MVRSEIHAGEHLAEQLAALDLSAAELARRLKVPAQSRDSHQRMLGAPIAVRRHLLENPVRSLHATGALPYPKSFKALSSANISPSRSLCAGV